MKRVLVSDIFSQSNQVGTQFLSANPNHESDNFAQAAEVNFDAARLLALAWIARRTVFMGAVVGVLLGIVALQLMPSEYTSYAVLRPNQEDSVLGHGGILGGGALSGLAGMFGLGSSSDFDAFSDVLTSDAVANALIKQHPNLLPTLFPGYWDEKAQSYVRTGVAADLKDAARKIVGLGPWHPPGTTELAKYLQANLSVSSDFKTKFLTISYTNKNPVFVRTLLTWIYSAADGLIRETARDRTAARIRYLQSVVPTVSQVEARQALSDLLASEEQRMMMVQADQHFSFVLVKPPLVPTRPSSASPTSALGIFLFLGAIMAGTWEIFIKPRIKISIPRKLFGRLRSSVVTCH